VYLPVGTQHESGVNTECSTEYMCQCDDNL